ncbi:hypothetical protein HDU83_009717 [Entophlyctis luteolus]|nr:hypothetical protein HDU83_009717 [Entophlyctis luteolus]
MHLFRQLSTRTNRQYAATRTPHQVVPSRTDNDEAVVLSPEAALSNLVRSEASALSPQVAPTPPRQKQTLKSLLSTRSLRSKKSKDSLKSGTSINLWRSPSLMRSRTAPALVETKTVSSVVSRKEIPGMRRMLSLPSGHAPIVVKIWDPAEDITSPEFYPARNRPDFNGPCSASDFSLALAHAFDLTEGIENFQTVATSGIFDVDSEIGLEFSNAVFDFVHGHLALSRTTSEDSKVLIREIVRVSKPEAFVELVEMDIVIYRQVEPSPESKMLDEHYYAMMKKKGYDLYAAMNLPYYIKSDANMRYISHETVSIPLGYGNELERAHTLSRKAAYMFAAPWMAKSMGIDQEAYANVVESVFSAQELSASLAFVNYTCVLLQIAGEASNGPDLFDM